IHALQTISLVPKVWNGPRNTSFTALLLRNVPSWFCLPLQGECIAEYGQNGASQEDKQTDLQTWIKKCRRMIGLFFHLRLPRLAGQQCFWLNLWNSSSTFLCLDWSRLFSETPIRLRWNA